MIAVLTQAFICCNSSANSHADCIPCWLILEVPPRRLKDFYLPAPKQQEEKQEHVNRSGGYEWKKWVLKQLGKSGSGWNSGYAACTNYL